MRLAFKVPHIVHSLWIPPHNLVCLFQSYRTFLGVGFAGFYWILGCFDVLADLSHFRDENADQIL